MIVLRWLLYCLLDFTLLLTVPVVAPIVSLFTRAGSHAQPYHTWGGWYGTYDNPPQGDEGFVRERSLFPQVTTGLKGYVNRVHWMIRNPLYGLARKMAVPYTPTTLVTYKGREDISDKEGRPGWYLAKAKDGNKLVAFEFYGVFPWGFGRCVRIRIGWKLMTDKYERFGFAQFVNTFNPLDGYN